MGKHKRILIIAPYNRGTIGLCSLNLWKALSKTGNFKIKFVIKTKFPDGLPELEECEYYTAIPPKGGLKNLSSFWKQLKWFKIQKQNFKPDLTISTLNSCSAFNIMSGGKEKKIGIFHSPHSQSALQGRISKFYSWFNYKFLYNKLDYLFCVSQEIKDSIIQNFPNIDSNKIKVVYNPHPLEVIKRKSLEKLSSKEEEIYIFPVLVYVGRFDANKAPERTLKAFIKAFPNSDEQLVFIGGDDKYASKLLSLIPNSYHDRIHFLGKKTNPYPYIKNAKALISSSISEGLPGVMIEANALGIPVITTNSSKGIWEIFEASSKYEKNLNQSFKSTFGIITPNNTDENVVIENLSSALSDYNSFNLPVPQSPFLNQLTFENVAKNYFVW